MSAPNFLNKNASKHFVWDIEKDIEFDFKKDDLQDFLEENGFDLEEDFTPQEENRSYPSICVASKSIEKVIADNTIEVIIYAIIRSGYYAGVNLDWDIQIETDNCSFYNEDVTPDQIFDDFINLQFSEGFAKIQSKNVVKWIYRTIPTLINELETIYEKISETYNRVGIFSNGEAIYEKS